MGRAAQDALASARRTFARRATDWADRRGLPVYSHIRGVLLLARMLRNQREDSLPAGRPGHTVRPRWPRMRCSS